MNDLDSRLQAELLKRLTPLFGIQKDRKGTLTSALGQCCVNFDQIDDTGAPEPFVKNLITTLHGFRSDTGSPALCVLLEMARTGVEKDPAIDELIAEIERLSRTPDDQGQADGWAVPADFRFGNTAMKKAAQRLGTPGGRRFGKLLCDRLRDKELADLGSAVKLVEFVAGCPAKDVQALFHAIRHALRTDPGPPTEHEAIRAAAVALYCLAASRTVENLEELSGPAFPVKDYRAGFSRAAHSKALLVYAVIAAALEGPEGLALRLEQVEGDPGLPHAPHVFHVHVPAEGQNAKNAFEWAAYRSVVHNNKEDLPDQCLDGSRDLGSDNRESLKARLDDIREVEDCCRALVVTGLFSPEPCREFAERNRVPTLILDEQARDLIAGMPAERVVAEIEEFWKAVHALSRAG